jgi:hypothetical protein
MKGEWFLDLDGWRIVFQPSLDRHGHRILCIANGGQEQLVAESVEGSPDDPWPPSPPLQHWSVEPRSGQGSILLAVGMAGSAHWSASVDRFEGGARFDVACRTTGLAARLGTRYRIGRQAVLVPASGDLCIRMGRARFVFTADSSNECPTRFDTCLPDEFALLPALAGQNPPCTVRWRYSVARHEAGEGLPPPASIRLVPY